MRVKVNGQIVAVCVNEYNDARQNVAAAWCLGLVACGLVLGACCFFYFLFFLGSVPVDTGLSIDYDLATPVNLLGFHPLLFFQAPCSMVKFALHNPAGLGES